MSIASVAIIGAGTMGGGIAIGCIAAGFRTCVIDLDAGRLEAIEQRARRFLDRAVQKERMSRAQADAAIACLRNGRDLKDVAGADLVIEAVFEDLAVKRDLLAGIANHLAPEAIVATNTSALRVAALADALPGPERFLGLHYFSPAEVNPLVEVVSGPKTSLATLDKALAFVAATEKTPLPCRDASGFAVNRFFCPYTNEAARLLGEGVASTAQIDEVACAAFDLPLGPFAVMNIIKPRIALNAVQNLAGLGAFYHPASALIHAGTERDAWEISATPAPLDDETAQLIAERLRAALFLPVLEAVGEKVAAPDDFDLGARVALRFGMPPVAAMRALGRDRTVALITPVAAQYGAGLPVAGLDTVFG
ncbi:MAG: 3-hydroxyacyl-CoA dehydrogenase family protein [Roseovarius sp.]